LTHQIGILLLAAVTVGSVEQATQLIEEQQPDKQTVYVAKRGWHTDFSIAQAEAARLGKPLLLHFHAAWCGPCRTMEQQVLNTPQVLGELGTSVVGVKIDSDYHPDLTHRFGVVGLPTDVFVSPEGNVVTRTSGSSRVSAYAATMSQMGRRHGDNKVTETAEDVKRVSNDEVDEGDEPLLNGYSPVAIMQDQLWQQGSHEFAVIYKGRLYHLGDEEQLEQFEAAPEQFAPAMLGYDPVELSTGGKQVDGDIRFGAFYRDRLYLLNSEANRQRFIENPAWYAQDVYVFQLEESQAAGIQ